MTKNFPIFNLLIIFAAIACNTAKQRNTSEELYKSSALTPVNSFTSGAEGPAVDKDGKLSLLEDSMGTANGIEVSPDEKTLYVNESVQRKVWAYDLSDSGTISNKRLLIEFPDFGMDGMRCDIDGNLHIARYGKGVVAKISPKGKLLKEIKINGTKPSNVTFGGADGRTVYVTLQDNGNIESFRVEVPGREWKKK